MFLYIFHQFCQFRGFQSIQFLFILKIHHFESFILLLFLDGLFFPPPILQPLLLSRAHLSGDEAEQLRGKDGDLVIDVNTTSLSDLLDKVCWGFTLCAKTKDELCNTLVTDPNQLMKFVTDPGQMSNEYEEWL